jgi:hypothetical protein
MYCFCAVSLIFFYQHCRIIRWIGGIAAQLFMPSLYTILAISASTENSNIKGAGLYYTPQARNQLSMSAGAFRISILSIRLSDGCPDHSRNDSYRK